MATVSDPLSELRVALDCIKYVFHEIRQLNKKHLMIGVIFCMIDFFASRIFTNISIIHYIHPFISTNTHPVITGIIYSIIKNILFIALIFTIQHFVSHIYWSRRYCNDSFRDSILSPHNDNYKINKTDGILVCYPWLILPILICHTLLNMIILLSHIKKIKDFNNDLWTYQFIETFFLFLTYYWLNRVIWNSLQQNHLFTIQNVLDFYSGQCLNTTKSLLSEHVLFIDGISQIIMEYIGPNPLPQFNFIATNLKNSICRLDVVYVSRVITLVFSIYSVFKIYSNSFYDQHDSNIFVALGTGIGVLMFGHMIRRLTLNFFFGIMRYFNFGNVMSVVLLLLMMLMPLLSVYFCGDGLLNLDLWIALFFDNALSAQYDFLYSEDMRWYIAWIRFGFARIGYVLMSAAFGWIVRNILVSSYGNAKL